MVSAAVHNLHSTLFPATNKKYGKLSQPNIFLTGPDAPGDTEPRCFSTTDELTYLFYFPCDSTLQPLQFGIWSYSVPTISAMQGALERCSHLPTFMTKNTPLKMTKIEVGQCNVIIMDSRTLTLRIASKGPTLYVLWTAKSKSRSNPNNNLILDKKQNFFVLKSQFKKYVSKGNYNCVKKSN